MKGIWLCCIMMLTVKGWTQDAHFMYIQTTNKAPFYVKLNGDVLSSTESGYIIIPQLIDDEVNISIGFIKKQWPEQHYRIELNGRDRGLTVQFKENGLWDLVDLQTGQVILTADKMPISGEKPTDEFSRVLAEISNDSGLNGNGNLSMGILSDQRIELVYSLLQKNRRKMIFEVTTKNEQQRKQTDTIELELDYRDSVMIEEENKAIAAKAMMEDSLAKVAEMAAQIKTAESVEPQIEEVKKNSEQVRFTACKQVAEEKDFVQLRKKMAGAEDEIEMLDLAHKAFKKKCYTTEQIRNLCMLILKDDNRYRFFEKAYPIVSDKNNFSLLQMLLQKEGNIEKFKTLIR